MHRFWQSIIEPVLASCQPNVIVEIGSDRGQNTRRLIEFCQRRGSRLHVIDPAPQYDPEAWQRDHPGIFEFHHALSLDALRRIEEHVDAALIDGDHNWYTVFHELRHFELRAGAGSFPLVFLHDVGWPYGRRDLYYLPETIPLEYRKPFRKLGLLPGCPELAVRGGLNRGFHNSIYENELQSGVLGAVEDFLTQTRLDLDYLEIPGFFGLGILYPKALASAHAELSGLLESIRARPNLQSHMLDVEQSRCESYIASLDAKAEIRRAAEQLEERRRELELVHRALEDECESHEQTRALCESLRLSSDAAEEKAKLLEARQRRALARLKRDRNREVLLRERLEAASKLVTRIEARSDETRREADGLRREKQLLLEERERRRQEHADLVRRIEMAESRLQRLVLWMDQLQADSGAILGWRAKVDRAFNAFGLRNSSLEAAERIRTTLHRYEEDKRQIGESAVTASTPPLEKPFRALRARARARTRILIVAHNASSQIFGGERSLIDVVRSVDRSRHDAMCVFPGRSDVAFEPIRDLAEILVMPYRWWDKEHLSAETVKQFERLIVEKRIDLVHSNTIMLLEPLLAARRLGVPSALHAREIINQDSYLSERIGLSPDEIAEIVTGIADHIIANSETTARLFDKGSRTHLLYNAIDTAELDLPAPEAGERLRIGMVSSNLPKKGLEDFVQLAKLAQARRMQAEFVLVGPVNDHIRHIQDRQRHKDLPGRIRFLDYQGDIRDCYRGLDVVVNLSHFAESFGRTVAEAMACRRPVICYAHGALPELVEDSRSGFLIPFGEYGQALEHIDALSKQPTRLRELGERGRQIASERFSRERFSGELNRIYARILDADSTSSLLRSASFHLAAQQLPPARYRSLGRSSPGPSATGQVEKPKRLASIFTSSESPVRTPVVRLLKKLERRRSLRPAIGILRKLDRSIKARLSPRTAPAPARREPDWIESVWQGRSLAHMDAGMADRREKLRIAYFLWHFPVPSETFVLNELRFLQGRGFDIKVYCRHSPHEDFRPDFPVEVHRVDSPRELAGMLCEHGRNILHSHFVYPTVTEFVWPACELAEVPFTFITHGQDLFRYTNMKRNRIGEVARSPWCLRVVVPGQFHRDFVIEQGVPAGKVVIIPQAVEIGAFEQDLERRDRRLSFRSICTLSRWVEKKGIEDLIRAAATLARDGISVHVYGYGPSEDAYRELIQDQRLENVHLRGAVRGIDELRSVFRKHDLFVLPSVRAADGDMDGVPTVLMEAMASGIPALSTDISSIPDLIHHGVNGFLCKPHDPAGIAEAVREIASLDPSRLDSIASNAREHIRERFSVERNVEKLIRLWRQDSLDIVIVAYENLPELQEVIRRVYAYTGMPFHLIVVDNHSGAEVVAYLRELESRLGNMTFLPLDRNVMVGPAINMAIRRGSSPYCIYLCAKEGFVMQSNWDQRMVDFMEQHPEVGLAGHRVYSPSYYDGAGYENRHPLFEKFRRKDFARDNPARLFTHVQGGLFILRRKMFEEIGGFSEQVPHTGTDVEYSYYAESCGWELGDIPGILSLFIKTLPPLDSKFDENTFAAHPLCLKTIDQYERIVRRETKKCNICGWTGEAFSDRSTCPACGSRPTERSLYRYLALSDLTYRRLVCLDLNPSPCLADRMRRMFSLRCLDPARVDSMLTQGQLSLPPSSADVIVASRVLDKAVSDRSLLAEIMHVLKPGGTCLVQVRHSNRETHVLIPSENDGAIRSYKRTSLLEMLNDVGLHCEQFAFSSQVIEFDWHDIFVCKKTDSPQPERYVLCPCCNRRFESFLPTGATVQRSNARCPNCGSLERHRLLQLFLKEETNLYRDKLKMLHVAPEPVFEKIFKRSPKIDYLSADLCADAMVEMDITCIQMADNTFDVIICNHVLEHIQDDARAMAELYRVLKPGGWAIILVPFRENLERTYEDPSIVSPEDRTRHFGQHDHVRWYGRDYKDRLAGAGFEVKELAYARILGKKNIELHGLMKSEYIHYCTKPAGSR
ncbi:MAG: glycosyltransferase [Deltaproteobacteria bacterium]|nr:glycosyltransferase [Deltaproteobacteria bacterium]